MNDFIMVNSGVFLPTTPSTNDYIRNCDFGSWVSAGEQTNGRGRSNKTWYSFGENRIIFSARVKLSRDQFSLPLLSCSTALAVFRFLQSSFPNETSSLCIKWPNDLHKNGKKIAGILIEPVVKPDSIDVVIGIGINLYASRIPEEIQDIADCLLHNPVEDDALPRKLAIELNSILCKNRDGSIKGILRDINDNSCLNGREIRFFQEQEKFGKVMETGPNGYLVVETDSGVIELTDAAESLRVL